LCRAIGRSKSREKSTLFAVDGGPGIRFLP
jgi:hypothetical protein